MKPTIASGDGNGGARAAPLESVAGILERQLESTIHDWMTMVEKEPELTRISLNYDERAGHLRKLLNDVIARLRLNTSAKAPISVAAGHHGDLRHKQGYTVANVVTESRLLQVCIFTTLHKNTKHIHRWPHRRARAKSRGYGRSGRRNRRIGGKLYPDTPRWI
ncbi:MAG TPA: hypothetical protein VGR94_05565 [Candidatus Acidoferrales bacterium]|nr:hypothetical protein [Candidatus Acidoferrales bacterium]